jgi:hypothetical protein
LDEDNLGGKRNVSEIHTADQRLCWCRSSILQIPAMKKYPKATIGLILIHVVLLCSSCEGNRFARGIVLDSSSKLPLAGVKCEVLNGGAIQITDSTGKFDIDGKFGSCVPDCKDITAEFSKDSYEVYQVDNPAIDLTILLQKK